MEREPTTSTINRHVRPTWPGQVRKARELQVGHWYQRVYTHLGPEISPPFKLLSKPYKGFLDEWWVKILNFKMACESSLSDMGVVPYKDGHWNTNNYIIHDPECQECRREVATRKSRPDYLALRVAVEAMALVGLLGGILVIALMLQAL